MANEMATPLTGSEKQVEWANRIRIPILDRLAGLEVSLAGLAGLPDDEAAMVGRMRVAIADIRSKSTASWWIDRAKELSARGLLSRELAPADPDLDLLRYYERAPLADGRLIPLPGVVVPTREEWEELEDQFIDLFDAVMNRVKAARAN